MLVPLGRRWAAWGGTAACFGRVRCKTQGCSFPLISQVFRQRKGAELGAACGASCSFIAFSSPCNSQATSLAFSALGNGGGLLVMRVPLAVFQRPCAPPFRCSGEGWAFLGCLPCRPGGAGTDIPQRGKGRSRAPAVLALGCRRKRMSFQLPRFV
jgi:hypothetical protein